MKRLHVFLSSAMTGELALERSGLQLYFHTDPVLLQFTSLYAIEAHASPHSIEQAFLAEVQDSHLLIVLLDKQLRPAVQQEFLTARDKNIRTLVFIRERTDARDPALAAFISSEAYKVHCGPFNNVADLCSKVKEAILGDLLNTYRRTAPAIPLPPSFVYLSHGPSGGNPLFTPAELDALRSNPNIAALNAEQLVSIAMLQTTEKWDFRTGLMLLELAINQDPHYWQAFHNKAQLLDDIGLKRDALLWSQRALELNPHSHPTLHNLGIHYYRTGDNAKAKGFFLRALHELPGKHSSLSYLVNIAFAEKNYADAETYARQALASEAGDLERANLAYALALNGKIPDAKAELNQMKGRSKEYLRAASYIEELDSNIPGAIDLLDEFTRRYGVERQLCVKKAFLLLHLGLYAQTRTWLEFVEKHVPLDAGDYNDLAWELVRKKIEFPFAAQLLEKAVSLDPSVVVAWKNLQLCYDSDATREEGLAVARRAYEFHPHNPGIAQNLRHSLLQAGRLQELLDFAVESGVNAAGSMLTTEQKDALRSELKANSTIADLSKLEELYRASKRNGALPH
jgi:tetratricopeptide (TPR) repeat protein